MKKPLYGLIAGLIAVGGFYFYQVHQINTAVDDISRQLSPVGRLEHGGASFSPFGEARINRLRFTPHDGNDEIAIRRVAVRTDGLLNLLRLKNTV
ncbi:hypothetical protein [Natronospira sp.]|uniref:hypothetical protein n=1 Tax=Natronospira sp. TaxID=2024970 RepID=UPI003872E062